MKVEAWMVHNCRVVILAAASMCLVACETIKQVAQPERADTSGQINFKSEPEMRIRVAMAAPRAEIAGSGYVVARPVGAGGKAQSIAAPVVITSNAQGLQVLDSRGEAHAFPFGTDLEVLPGDGAADGVAAGPKQSLTLGGTRYPGFFTVRPRWNDRPATMDVVVTMGVESYLPGVLSHELWKDWPRQTYEIQAVAARTYALHERSRARAESRPWDVEDTTADQVYGGTTTAVLPNEAARVTRGIVLTSGGRLLRAYYSSQCGGRAASAQDVWPTRTGWEFNLAKPLQGEPRTHACQRSPLYRWEVSRRDDDVNRRLRAWGTRTQNEVSGITKLRSLEVLERNDAERPNKYRLTDDRGHEYTLRAEELREALNEPVPGLTAIVKETRVSSGDLEAEIWADQIRFRGRGWGHGVGMCQWCAKGLADQGMDWRQMATLFYPGAEVQKLY